MKNVFGIVLSVCAVAMFASGAEAKSRLSDSEIRQRIISESIASYPGRCPCPYNGTRNGSSCGGRSAWSRAGGYSPICYANEISKAQVDRWRAAH